MTLVIGLELMGANRGVSPLFNAPFDDPDDPLKMIKGGPLTMTRTTTKMFLNPNTLLLEEAAVDQLAIEANGALIEGRRTNLLTYSEAFDNVVWDKNAGGTTITANQGNGPDDTLSADRVTNGNGNSNWMVQRPALSAENTYSFSLWIKKLSGTTLMEVSIWDDVTTWQNEDVTSQLITNEWVLVSINATTGVGSTTFAVGLGNNISDDRDVLIWGAQLELGAFPSSYIPTVAAAVMRTQDVLRFPSAGNMDAQVGTIIMQSDSLSTQRQFIARLSGNTLFYGEAGALKYNDGSARDSGLTVPSDGTVSKIGLRWDQTPEAKIVKDGVLSAALGFDGDLNLVTDIGVGTKQASTSAWGHIKNFKIYDVAFTDAQMIAETS